MHLLTLLYPALLLTPTATALRSAPKTKLSSVQSLTLRANKLTTHRRVPAAPQLKCIGGSAQNLYEIDVMRCKNAGADYDAEDIQWTCTASLPEEFKLGSTDVVCEGYESADDPWVLKGSCGVEYRLVLTDKGREKYGHRPNYGDDKEREGSGFPKTMGERVAGALFWMLFLGVAVWIAFNIYKGWRDAPAAGAGGGNRPGWGGGGGGWGGNDDDPPPPYDYRPQPKREYGAADGSWRPGFWTGATGGAAAGYAAGRWGGNNSNNNRGGSSWGNGEGSSRSSSGSSSYSSTRHESTGFGSTSRR